MSGRHTSIEYMKHPYQRLICWVNGYAGNPPIRDAFKNKTPDTLIRLDKTLEDFQRSGIEWTKRPDNWRKVNGYPE